MCCLHPLVLFQILQVNQRKRAGGRLPWPSGAMNNLDWLTAIETKSRPQDLMSSHYLMRAALQSLHIQLAFPILVYPSLAAFFTFALWLIFFC